MARGCEGQNAASVEFALRNARVHQNWRCFAAACRGQTQRSKAGSSASPRVTEWCRSSAGSVCGQSERVCAPRLSVRSSAWRAMRRASGWGSSARACRPVGVAHEAGVAPQRRAGLGAGRLRARAPSAARRPRRAARTRPPSAARAPKTKHSRQRVGGQAVGAVQAGARALADGVEPGHRRRAVEVGDDPAHAVVRRRRHGDELGRRIEPRLAQRADDVGEQQRVDRAHVEVDARRARSRSSSTTSRAPPRRAARARRRSARRAASRRVAPSPRIASVTRKPSRPLMPVTAVGWNCMSSRSASAAPAPRASSRPMPSEPGGLVVRCHRAAEPPVARMTARAWIARPSSHTTPTQRPSRTHRVAARAPSMTVTPAVSTTTAESWRTTRRPVALPPACTTRRRECPPSRPSARLPWRSASKCTPRRSRSPTVRGRLAAQDGRGARAHQVAPGALGVLAMQVGGVVGRQRRRQAALRPVARGARQRRGGDERDARAGAGPGQRGVEARGAGADDDQVGLDARGSRPCAGTVTRCPRRSCFATRRRWSTTPGPIPSARRGSSPSSARSAERDWLGWDVRESPAAEREVVCAVHPEAYVEHRWRPCRRRAAARWTPTRSISEGSYRAALHAAGGAAALVDALLGGDGPRFGASLHRPPGPPRAAGARDGLLPLQQRRGGRAARARSLGRRAGADPRLGRPPRQRDQRHLPPRSRRALREHPRVAAVSRARARPATAGRGRGRATRSTCPCRRVPATRRGARWSSTSWSRSGSSTGRAWSCISAGFDAHVRDPLAGCRVTREGYAQMAASMRGAGRRARRAARRGARGRLRPRGAGRVDGGDARGGRRRGSGERPRAVAPCTRRPRRPRGGWRGAGRWWGRWRRSWPAWRSRTASSRVVVLPCGRRTTARRTPHLDRTDAIRRRRPRSPSLGDASRSRRRDGAGGPGGAGAGARRWCRCAVPVLAGAGAGAGGPVRRSRCPARSSRRRRPEAPRWSARAAWARPRRRPARCSWPTGAAPAS